MPAGYKIKLQFYHFVLENTYECASDLLRIYDGRNSSATPLGKYCGRLDPFKVESTTTDMFISFRSDRSLNFAGFRATFTAIAVRPVKAISFRRTNLKNTTAVLGEEVKFLCQVRGGSVNVVISWTKDGEILSDDGPNYTIRYKAVTKKSHILLEKLSRSDAGVYGCLARDLDMGRNISAYGRLLVKGKAYA